MVAFGIPVSNFRQLGYRGSVSRVCVDIGSGKKWTAWRQHLEEGCCVLFCIVPLLKKERRREEMKSRVFAFFFFSFFFRWEKRMCHGYK